MVNTSRLRCTWSMRQQVSIIISPTKTFTYVDTDGSIAVIATHFQLSEAGETTSLLTQATANIANITKPGTITETGALDFAPFVAAINAQALSQYTGSLTTPPCAEGLSFFVTSKQLPLNVATYNKIKSVIGFNARFVQAAPGKENLLSAASKQIQKQSPLAGTTSASASSAAKTTAAATSTAAAERVEAVKPTSVAAPVAAPVATRPAVARPVSTSTRRTQGYTNIFSG